MKTNPPELFLDDRLHFQEFDAVKTPPPELSPYRGLAVHWHDYTRRNLPHYPSFLCHLAQERGIDVGPILDLACGDGTLAERLAVVASEVVGLDASDHMLDQARARFGRLPGVSFVLGDFRSFELNRQFASIVCASNSLNYVTGPRELSTVFRRVAAHLRPGGLFVFDTITEKGMRALSGLYLHFTSGNGRFALRFSYDAQRRTEKSEAILAEGIEWHRRVPIDLADVQAAADESGLHVDDFFTYARIPGRWALGTYCVFVLSK